MDSKLTHLQSTFTADCVIFGFDEGGLKVLLVERNEYPYKDWWALPGFFVEHDETIDDAVKRILYEHTGLRNIFMEQLYTFGDLKRHPQGRIITVAYYALLRLKSQLALKPHSDYVRQAVWHSVDKLPELAFDHANIIERSLEKIRQKIKYSPIVFELLPEKFTLTQLQKVYEAILGNILDKRNFRKKILNYDFLKELDEKQEGVAYRAAKLYKFDKRKYTNIFQKKIIFKKNRDF